MLFSPEVAGPAGTYRLPGMSASVVTEKRPGSAELLARLVGFDTTSRNANLALIGFVRDYLDAEGVWWRISHDASGEKANLHAVVGEPRAGGLAFAGHVDTVPVDGQRWTADPFTLRRSDGRLYGRGAADMKGFLACCLAMLPELKARRRGQPVHLFFTYDEEVGCHGARRLIEDLKESGLRPDLCVVGEPSAMRPVLRHKERLAVRVTVRGRAGHSSEPARGVNALHAAAEAVAWLAGEARRRAAEGPFDTAFTPPHTSVHVGMMQGGTALNIIPAEAGFIMEWRCLPGEDAMAYFRRFREFVAETIEPAMQRVDPGAGFRFEIADHNPALSLDPGHRLAEMVRAVTETESVGAVSYGTEAGIYQEAGIASVVCGPGGISEAHKPDEWIAESELAACERFIGRIVDRLSG